MTRSSATRKFRDPSRRRSSTRRRRTPNNPGTTGDCRAGTGRSSRKNGYQVVVAEVPKAEMADYVISLRAMTQGRGRFDYEVVRYEEVPGPIA
ncbi:MAG: hypothetical protein J6P88_04415, partial [Clostridia bacterium]|nr:hypothetical protein [Clostridia bacterium]